jgi:hypothetical protein
MKSTVADYQTRIFAVRIEAVDGSVARFVQYPHELVIDGETYLSQAGYEFTGMSVTSSASPPVVDFKGFLSDTVGHLSRDEVASRVWDNARAYVFATSWAAPVEDEEPLGQFILGKSRVQDDQFTFELMGLIDVVTQKTGAEFGPLCRWTLFDETLDGETIPWVRSRCTGPRAAPDGPALADFKVTGTVTSVTDRLTFRDSARAEAVDYFGAGSIRFTGGANAGLLSEEIKSYAADGTVTLYLPFYYSVQVGDAYEMIPGCRKRRTEDCITKYSNAVNHGGFDQVPTNRTYTTFGTGGA